MNKWIILLRGVNVSGKNKLPMTEFREALTDKGFTNVQSYIQSGNVVLQADKSISKVDVSTAVNEVLLTKFDIETSLMLLTEQRLKEAAQANPWGQIFEKANWMFLFFLSDVPASPDLDKLTEITTENERWELVADVFYVYAGDGAGRSKLIARAEKLLGIDATYSPRSRH